MKNKKILNCIYIILSGITLWYIIESIYYYKEISEQIHNTVLNIVNVVFPSLFGIMVICEFIVKSRIYTIISIPLIPISKYIFNLPVKLFMVYLLSSVGGYPIGVKMLSLLVKDKVITKNTASKFAPFCYCVSPSFAIGVVGVGIFSNVKIGMMCYLSCFIANTMFLLVFSRIYRFKSNDDKTEVRLYSSIINESVYSASKSIFLICGVIIFFSYIITILDCLKLFDIIENNELNVLLKSILEITNITRISNKISLLPLITAVISTGGICTLLQTYVLCDNAFEIKCHLIMRTPISLISYLIYKIFFSKTIIADHVILYAYSENNQSELNIISLICLFFMIIIIFFQKKNCNFEKSVL